MSIPLTLVALQGALSVLRPTPISGWERPLLRSTVLSALLFAEVSLEAGGDASLSTLLTCCGPGVGGHHFWSLLCHNPGPKLAQICSAMRAASVSDPSSSGNRVWLGP